MKQNISSRGLTLRYSLYQTAYFAACAGYSAFAATYLLDKGFNASQVGVILAVTNLLSCIIQPILGDFADRLKTFILPKMVVMFLMCSFICFTIIQLCNLSLGLFGVLYGIGMLLTSITVSLNNSICVYYTERNYPVNYGIGTGIGSLSFSFASLGLGYVIAWLGTDWMMWTVLIFLIIQMIIVLGYPKISETNVKESDEMDNMLNQRVSLVAFFGKYKFFSITMIGVGLIAMCHFMAENYLITLFQSMGGGSENVGIALFVASLSATPFLLLFEKVQKKINIRSLMRLSGIFYICKVALMLSASEIWNIYLIQLLQTVTYGFLYPSLFYFVKQRIAEADMVKGQAVSVVAFTIGTALGSFVGGRAIDYFNLDIMLLLALTFAGIGMIIINLAINKHDFHAKHE